MNCKNILQKGLSINIDINDNNSWNENEPNSLRSLNIYNYSFISGNTFPDFGLTAYDVGLLSNLKSSFDESILEKVLKLNKIAYNNASGITETLITSGITNDIIYGNYQRLNGGYFQGFFKLHDYNYEIFPYRYPEGITIETWIRPISADTNTTSNIFYYMGARAENKFSLVTYGETGYTTSLGNQIVIDDHSEDLEKGIFDNVIAFLINPISKKLGYKYIDSEGFVKEGYSLKQISNFYDWKMITIVYRPYEKIENINKLDCSKRRKGDLIFYVNGRHFHKFKDFDEFWFTPLFTEKEKQLGVPYNISWGGGSFGLKHSYHFIDHTSNDVNYEKDSRKDNLLIEQHFDSSFIGDIQKLRVYIEALRPDEIMNNFEIDKYHYNLKNNNGGRIIYI